MNQADPKNISDAEVAQLDKTEELKYRDGHFQTNLSSTLLQYISVKCFSVNIVIIQRLNLVP